jgi:hypothetical protein
LSASRCDDLLGARSAILATRIDFRSRAVVKTVLGSIFLLGLVAFGLALAFNFRGITSKHAKKSVAAGRPIRALYRQDLTPEELQRRVARQTVLERIIGMVFALFGSASLIALITGFATAQQHR